MHPFFDDRTEIERCREICRVFHSRQRGGFRSVPWEDCFNEAIRKLKDDPRMTDVREAGRLIFGTFCNCVRDSYRLIVRTEERNERYAWNLPPSSPGHVHEVLLNDDLAHLRKAIARGALGTEWIDLVCSAEPKGLPLELKRLLPLAVQSLLLEQDDEDADQVARTPDYLTNYGEYRRILWLTTVATDETEGGPDVP